MIGSLLLILAMFEGYFGYSLPDDLLSGIGLRAALSSITLGMPVIGTWLHWALFGGDFPWRFGDDRSSRACTRCTSCFSPESSWRSSASTWRCCGSRSTPSSPGRAAPRRNVVGVRVMPVFAVKSGAFFAMTTGILGLMGGLLQINPIWQLGRTSRRRCRRAASPTST